MSKEGIEEKVTGFSWGQLLTVSVLIIAVPIVWSTWLWPYIQQAKAKLLPSQ